MSDLGEVLHGLRINSYHEAADLIEQLTRTAETLLAALKRGDDPAAAMYQLEEVLSDAP